MEKVTKLTILLLDLIFENSELRDYDYNNKDDFNYLKLKMPSFLIKEANKFQSRKKH